MCVSGWCCIARVRRSLAISLPSFGPRTNPARAQKTHLTYMYCALHTSFFFRPQGWT